MSNKGKKNLYTCARCKRQIVTIDVDDGVTPFSMMCSELDDNDCDGLMGSTFYIMPKNAPDPTYEWYKPTAEEIVGMSRAMREHVDKGGLDIRPIGAK